MKSEVFFETSRFITGTIVYPIVFILGFSGNVLVLCVLQHKKMQTKTSEFLRGLAISDMVNLLNNLLYFLYAVLIVHQTNVANEMLYMFYPTSHFIFNQMTCISAWLTVCIGIERWMCVCRPTIYKTMYKKLHARVMVVSVYILFTLLTVPTALRYEGTTEFQNTTNATVKAVGKTQLGESKVFNVAYYRVFLTLIRSLLPLLLLVSTSTKIILRLRAGHAQCSSKAKKVTTTLLIVITCFVVCIFPDALITTLYGYEYIDAGFTVRGIREISDCLIAINCAINFAIYLSANSNFRECCIDIFKKRPASQQNAATKMSNAT